MTRYQNLVNGKWKSSEQEITIYSPINQEELGTVPAMTQTEADEAMQAARAALPAWRALSAIERAAYLHKTAAILERDKEKIGTILAKEVAKGIKAAIGEVVRTADLIRYAAEEGLRITGQAMEGGGFEAASKNKLAVVRREPVGIVLAIAPFNYPVNLSASKIAPALIAGNVVMFKPPTQGSISGLLLAKAFEEAGIPAGVFNTITGRGSEIGDYIIEHKEVNFINFTGSTPIGERIGRLAGMRPIMLELGGKDAALVLEDADLEHAAKQIVAGAFSYSGQRCTAIKRVIVLESVADKLATLLQEEVSKLTVGDPFDNADITPVIDNASADFIWGLIEDAQEKEAQALSPIKREGNLLWPVLFDQVTKDMKVAWEEPFGPVLPIIRVASVEEAIAFANESEFGLQSSVFTNDFKKAFEIAEKLEVGTVHINNKTQRGPDNFPFLGVKGSGAGVQGIKYSIEAMTNVKSIVFDVK
ncbi:TPA: NADP-dependent glyceraldehyde-3-phosphate dehydrogenase [Streptococcus pneumoniae]|uniref:NADP-dependent glyceraldehyde-3-phosphate dehydrogenase n=1 Tax=Streptococcus pneumoniae (strain 70585) TaxID=488221 RepID=C1C7B3_STRP7|nr:NADP-dependent glyceraldehyde-3-phosphate dehydrogenase [Streptococcus pneumoniae]ACO17903.1 NADP-dependent glyceraldehyde-3-phosphate dehydrogenase [Streptococcus pneumoniae 70585]MBW5023596.1 NADP-dependent glyceraldehyde-3-phosphate dehydrogenase [Streptococcus pneumoniae]MDS2307448.1 NADP-dependent glyceraldehyde-3-phosphate dehydrogenase [Streptococcus pneumoniae]MDS2630236.1 NADP-dependent glyceraldehyde-3-phosphate dehydrogenase [Streptococcus pneumoniae]MDS3233094.1 NADP-dependent g